MQTNWRKTALACVLTAAGVMAFGACAARAQSRPVNDQPATLLEQAKKQLETALERKQKDSNELDAQDKQLNADSLDLDSSAGGRTRRAIFPAVSSTSRRQRSLLRASRLVVKAGATESHLRRK